jgi:hypothetical protein
MVSIERSRLYGDCKEATDVLNYTIARHCPRASNLRLYDGRSTVTPYRPNYQCARFPALDSLSDNAVKS